MQVNMSQISNGFIFLNNLNENCLFGNLSQQKDFNNYINLIYQIKDNPNTLEDLIAKEYLNMNN